MKKFYILFLLLFLAPNILPQNEWNLVWSLHEKPFQPPLTGSEMAIVKAGFDTDEDGMGEFLCAYTDLDSNYILMYEATGNNNYELVWYWKYPVSANTFAGIVVGDLDHNGKVEIITTMPSTTAIDPNPDRLWAFEWSGVIGENKYGAYTGDEFEPTSSWNFDLADNIDFRPYSLLIEDIDDDGRNELIVGVRQSNRNGATEREVLVVSVSGDLAGFGAWDIEYNLQGLTGGALYSVTTGDLDNDGKKEIYALVWNFISLFIVECTGPDQYELVNSIEEIFQPTGIDHGALDAVVVADVNADNVNEMYIASMQDNAMIIVTGITDVSTITADDFKIFSHFAFRTSASNGVRSMQSADPNKDGNLNLLIAGERNGQIFDFEYSGSGDPSDSTSWITSIAYDIFVDSGTEPTDSVPLSPRLFYGHPAGDMDGDGLEEYVFVNYSTDHNVWAEDAYVRVIEAANVVGVEDISSGIPTEFNLANNYPNPFNPTTNIRYSIPSASKITLRIYDALGREVKVLLDEWKEAGNYNVKFDAQNLPSGVYFYQLNAGNFAETKKMILTK